jgi:outer membrane immunogenic protein
MMRGNPTLRNVLLGAVLLTTPGVALADGAAESARDPYDYVLEASDYWSGFYAGGHIGGATAGWGWTFTNPNEAIDQRRTTFLSGVHGGLQTQFGWLVLGTEVTYDWAKLGDTSASVAAVGTTRITALTNMLAVAGRIGVAQDNMLAYFKGGAATAEITFRSADAVGVTTSSSGREWGWLGGVGFEYGLTRNILIGVEYNYLNFSTGTRNQIPTPIGVAGSQASGSIDVQTLTARLSLKFP